MAALPEPWKSLRAALERLSERVKKIENTSPFSGTGLSIPSPGTTQVDGSLNVSGELNVTGDTVIGGTLSLPAGIIDNDALANPVLPAVAHADANNFNVTASWVTKCSVTVPVPAGFTRALILSLAVSASALNSNGSLDWLYCSASIPAYGGGLPGWVISSQDVPAGEYGKATDFRAVLLTGLSGSFAINAEVSTDSGTWAANVNNVLNLDASILFLR